MTSWQWVKANPDAAARCIRDLERENAELRKTLLFITQKHDSISELFTSYEDCAANLAATASAALKKLQ